MTDFTLFKVNLKGAIRNYHYESKYLYLMFLLINTALYFTNLLSHIFNSRFIGYKSDGGILNQGSIYAFICFSIFVILISSRKSLKSRMAFPVSRFSLSMANMIMMLFSAFVLFAIVSGFSFLEVLCYRFLAIFSNRFIMVSYLSFESYTVGLLLFFFYLIVFGSFIYTVLMCVKKWKIQSIIALSVLIAFPIINNNLVMEFFYFFNDVVLPKKPIVVIPFLLMIYILLHCLAYLPFKLLEVEK